MSSTTALGFTAPDLTVSGTAGPVTAWGGNLTVTVDLKNIASDTVVQPLSLQPEASGPTDAPASSVGVFITPTRNSVAGAYFLGNIAAPALNQNSMEQLTASFQLPNRLPGFPTGTFYVRFLANNGNTVMESNANNNLSKPVSVRVSKFAAPRLQTVALDVPSTMQPGDSIRPVIQVANLGTANTHLQGPVQVALVASTTPDFNVGSSVLAVYAINDIPSQSTVPLRGRARASLVARTNLTANNNVATITGDVVTLPTEPSTYYLGVVIDPYHHLTQLSAPRNRLEEVRTVGPATSGLPPAGVITAGGGANSSLFPTAVDGQPIGYL
jgi:hypothetical protein